MTVHHGNFFSPAADALLSPLRNANPARPYVIAQLGQSLDGRIATLSGASRWINAAAALDHLHRLRANVDAVVVGAGTVTADDPELTVRRVPGRHPVRVVIDPRGRIPANARCLADDGTRRIVINGHRTDGAPAAGPERIVIAAGNGWIDPKDIVAELFKAGLKRILVEGGARTISSFIDAGAADRLHVLVAPVILGSGIPGLSLKPIDALCEAIRPKTRVHVLDDGDVVFDCDLRQQDGG